MKWSHNSLTSPRLLSRFIKWDMNWKEWTKILKKTCYHVMSHNFDGFVIHFYLEMLFTLCYEAHENHQPWKFKDHSLRSPKANECISVRPRLRSRRRLLSDWTSPRYSEITGHARLRVLATRGSYDFPFTLYLGTCSCGLRWINQADGAWIWIWIEFGLVLRL